MLRTCSSSKLKDEYREPLEISQSLASITIPEPNADQNNESLSHIDQDFDVNANEDDLALPPEDELTTKKWPPAVKSRCIGKKEATRAIGRD